jgi:hypothetical protein
MQFDDNLFCKNVNIRMRVELLYRKRLHTHSIAAINSGAERFDNIASIPVYRATVKPLQGEREYGTQKPAIPCTYSGKET